MTDLQLSLGIMGALCVLAWGMGWRLQGGGRVRAARWVTLLMTGVMCVYLTCLWDAPILVKLLPYSGVIILGNWLPVMGAWFAGVCSSTAGIPMWRRVIFSAGLMGLSVYSLMSPLIGESPRCMNVEFERILEFQTTEQTCSAACAASLLRLHGIDATEKELTDLCLTREGTHWMGVYRGLMLKTAGTEWRVVVERLSGEELAGAGRAPGVLSLTFHGRAAYRPQGTESAQNTGHSVVSLGTDRSGSLRVFDPSPDYGFETWDELAVQEVESAVLLRLESRSGRIPEILRGAHVLVEEENRVYWTRR